LYGENDNYNLLDSHVIPGLIDKIDLAKKQCTFLEVLGTGKAIRQFLHNADDLSKIIYQL
jgi:GDP-L-fucose synthase